MKSFLHPHPSTGSPGRQRLTRRHGRETRTVLQWKNFWHHLSIFKIVNVFLDYFLTIFHSAFVLFVLTGWIFKPTRKIHIIAIGLILIAWLGIGWYKGVIGYCPLTDWHWDIKRELGERNIPSSFIEYMLEKITGLDLNRKLVDAGTAVGLILSVLCAGYVNLHSRFSKN